MHIRIPQVHVGKDQWKINNSACQSRSSKQIKNKKNNMKIKKNDKIKRKYKKN